MKAKIYFTSLIFLLHDTIPGLYKSRGGKYKTTVYVAKMYNDNMYIRLHKVLCRNIITSNFTYNRYSWRPLGG